MKYIRPKTEGARVATVFSNYYPMGTICCHSNNVLIQSGPKPNEEFPNYLPIKSIFMFESVERQTDGITGASSMGII